MPVLKIEMQQVLVRLFLVKSLLQNLGRFLWTDAPVTAIQVASRFHAGLDFTELFRRYGSLFVDGHVSGVSHSLPRE